MKSEPVLLVDLIKIVLNSAIVWAVIMGFVDWSDGQQAATIAFAMALINVIGAVVQRSNVYASDTVEKMLNGKH